MKRCFLKRVISLVIVVTLSLALLSPVVVSADAQGWQAVLDSPYFGPNFDGGGAFTGQTSTANGILIVRTPVDQFHNNRGIAIDVAGLRALYGGSPDIVIEGFMDLAGISTPPLNMAVTGISGLRAPINHDTGEFSLTIVGSADIVLPDWAAGDGNTTPFINSSRNGITTAGIDFDDRTPVIWYNPDFTITGITVGSQSIFELLADGAAENLDEIDETPETVEEAPAATPAPPVVAPPVATGAFPGNIVYSLELDSVVQGLSIGASGTAEAILGDTPFLMQGGDPTITVVANPLGGNAILISDRATDYNSIDIVTAALNLSDGVYSIRVRGSINGGAGFTITGSENPWGWLGDYVWPDDNGNFQIIRSFTTSQLEAVGASGAIRLNTSGYENDYTIYDITIISGMNFPAPAQNIVRLDIGSASAWMAGTPVELDYPPFIAEGRTMVPLRFVAEAMGATVGWDAAAHAATIEAGEISLVLPVGVPLPDDMGTPEIRGGRTFVPLRFVGESLGALDIGFDAGAVTILLPAGMGAHAGEAAMSTGPYTFNFTPGEHAEASAFGFYGIDVDGRGPYIEWQWGYSPAGGDHGGDGYVLRGQHIGTDPEGNSFYLAQRNSLRINFPQPLAYGTTYEVSAWIFIPSDDTAGLSAGHGNVREGKGPTFYYPSFLVNMQPGNEEFTFRAEGQNRVPLDTWYNITATIAYANIPIDYIDLRFHGNTWQSYPDVWYVDSITITPVG
ncbi:MAG: copper amine oxidase N-terminal domain-containing protein [Defluviitaleaceae bacterium]|nr:copper amine oxidase N-terminal domain-containing protein [Defluviitaleaceae bacterium]